MDLKEELIKMQKYYDRWRLKDISLNRPRWLTSHNPISSIYKDKAVLLKDGTVCFACIVQANEILFRDDPPIDCPGQIVYSADPYVADNPGILQEIADQLYQYKNKPLKDVPEEYREIVRTITDEHDYSAFTFTLNHRGHPVMIQFMAFMIFRKLLPKRRLCGGLLPILTVPGCKSVMILPKQYWTRKFRSVWVQEGI